MYTSQSNCTVRAHLQVGCEGIGKSHAAREGGENEIAHLDAVGRDDVAEAVVIVAEELREVVQQHQQHTQRTPVQPEKIHRTVSTY